MLSLLQALVGQAGWLPSLESSTDNPSHGLEHILRIPTHVIRADLILLLSLRRVELVIDPCGLQVCQHVLGDCHVPF